ncbi:hypothetical protein PMIN06_002586 [Paraphaeosphaeria minitans]
MCLSALFAPSVKKPKTSASTSSRKRPSGPRDSPRYEKIAVVAEAGERRWAERPDLRPSRNRHKTLHDHTRPQYLSDRRPTLAVNVPPMWHRRAGSTSSNSSEEMLLNPRPDRPAANGTRHRHAKHTSQSTLRGRGAKRQRTIDSRDDHPSSQSSPKPPRKKTQSRALENPPRSHRSSRQHQYHALPSEPQPPPSRSRRHHSHVSHHPSARANTAARPDPSDDRRFAVLAATNTALEHLRREAFAQPSPPPPPRLRRYQGVQIPASSVPFAWDCISSQTQNSARNDEGSSRQRRSR